MTPIACPWYYTIQHGPDGEDNYAWVYDGNSNMVATMKIHHAQAVVGTMNSPSITTFLDGVLADHNVIARVSDESEQGKTRVRFIVEALKQEASR